VAAGRYLARGFDAAARSSSRVTAASFFRAVWRPCCANVGGETVALGEDG
jgi:hypothetical protein